MLRRVLRLSLLSLLQRRLLLLPLLRRRVLLRVRAQAGRRDCARCSCWGWRRGSRAGQPRFARLLQVQMLLLRQLPLPLLLLLRVLVLLARLALLALQALLMLLLQVLLRALRLLLLPLMPLLPLLLPLLRHRVLLRVRAQA